MLNRASEDIVLGRILSLVCVGSNDSSKERLVSSPWEESCLNSSCSPSLKVLMVALEAIMAPKIKGSRCSQSYVSKSPAFNVPSALVNSEQPMLKFKKSTVILESCGSLLIPLKSILESMTCEDRRRCSSMYLS